MDYQCTQPSEEIDKIIQRTQERGIEICRQNEELNRVHEETMQMLRELIKIQEEKRIFEEAARQEDEKRIAIEKEAAELEAKRKSQECLNIEEKSIPQASIRSRKSRIDPTLRNFTISTKNDLDVVIPIPPGIDERCFNAESDLLESLLNRDSPIDSTKIDSIFDEFSLPRPPEESNSEYSDATIESLFPSPIPVEDSDSLMEEIDLFLASDDSMPPGIEIDDYDSEGDIRFLEELLSSDSPSRK
ncbi:hypothetical protein Tco_0785116 [Tanacetum coccineum]